MPSSRRDLLAATGALVAGAGFAGCTGLGSDTGDGDGTEGGPSEDGSGATQTAGVTADAAVAAEWNAMRSRLWDALSLGSAGEYADGAAVAQHTFARFEAASGEYGAHERLEATDESAYEGFEEALGELRTAGLDAEDLERAREEAGLASANLADAQTRLVGESTAAALDLQLLGAVAQNATALASAGYFEAARQTAAELRDRFEEGAVSDALESTDEESYAAFETALDEITTAAENEDAEAAQTSADDALAAALDGSYALAGSEAVAGAGHIATLQARGWDAAAVAAMGGPSTAFAHAGALTVYRARAFDAAWLAANGESDRAAAMARDIFAHFEEARAHEALEAADHDAYEGFEDGLSALQTAIRDGDQTAVEEAVAAVDENLVAGTDALAGADAALLESAFFRTRFADARERYHRGEYEAAAALVEELFERFEQNELDLHESIEVTSEELYHRFEEEHLAALIDAFRAGDDDAVETHYEGVRAALSEFETAAGTTATASVAEAGYAAGRGFDAAVLDALGDSARAEAIAQATFERFESDAGGYHEALEDADESIYEAFEDRLGAVGDAAAAGDDVYPVAKAFDGAVVDSIYAIVESGGGSHADAAVAVLQEAVAHFEEARVHELLEDADRNAYETFEAELDAYIATLQEGGDVTAAAASFARGAQYAQFALVDAVEDLPLELRLAGSSGGEESDESGDDELQGGPNVVEGVPDDADHVVDMKAVAFEPAELTVAAGETVAFVHAGGEPHTVFAYEDEIPTEADYWASGGFDSQSAAEDGWEAGQGAVQSGQAYVRTFETTGSHGYYCAPHEGAGMVGTVTVE